MSNKAAVLKEKGARFTVEERSIPKPEANDILVKNQAISTAPVDWKMQDYGVLIDSYPVILGSDVAGTVEAVGSGVTHFKKGDRVTGFADVLSSKDPKNGAFQQYSIVKVSGAAKIPESMSFEEAAILPMAVATSAVGIFLALDVPRLPTKQQGAFLVWGASSSVGTVTIQIAKLLGYTVYGVNSPKHNDYVKKLGATECFNYNDNDITKKIIESINSASHKSVVAYDCISEHGSAHKTAEIVEALGGGKVCLTQPWPEDSKKPDHVEIVSTFAARIVSDSKDFGTWVFNEWLEKSLADKTFVPSPAIQKVDGGIDALQKAVDLHKAGLSGVKLVLPL